MGPVLCMIAAGTDRADVDLADTGQLQLPAVQTLQIDPSFKEKRLGVHPHQTAHGVPDLIADFVTAEADAGSRGRWRQHEKTIR